MRWCIPYTVRTILVIFRKNNYKSCENKMFKRLKENNWKSAYLYQRELNACNNLVSQCITNICFIVVNEAIEHQDKYTAAAECYKHFEKICKEIIWQTN